METKGSLLLVRLYPVSAITQEPSENPHCLSGKAKRGPPKFTNLDLDSYDGQVILKDKFVSQCASDIRIVTTATAAGPCSLFR